MHKLLARQLAKLGTLPHTPGLTAFLEAVDAAYVQADRDRAMIERSLELASQELLERNRQLREDLERRKRLQVELAQTEKLRAVGQLAAGIAHELNTPVQYVSDNVAFLQRAFAVLSELAAQMLGERSAGAANARLEFMRDNVPGALEAALEGCRRIAEIIGAMQTFAQPDELKFAPADLNAGLGSMLEVARSVVRFVAEVELDLGELPEVECRFGDMNQVFLNLLTNAAHAVADKYGPSGALGHIRIVSRREGGHAVIEVSDDGCGIPRAIQGRIFEPFFTTKEVGRGTGQGLAMCRSIVVEQHGGRLTFRSVPGEGSTFRVELPFRHVRTGASGTLSAVRQLSSETVSREAPPVGDLREPAALGARVSSSRLG